MPTKFDELAEKVDRKARLWLPILIHLAKAEILDADTIRLDCMERLVAVCLDKLSNEEIKSIVESDREWLQDYYDTDCRDTDFEGQPTDDELLTSVLEEQLYQTADLYLDDLNS